MRIKNLYTIHFHNRFTKERKIYRDCVDQSKGLRTMFNCPDGNTLFFDLGQCLVLQKMNMERTKVSEDTNYIDLHITVLTDKDFELIADTLGEI